MWFDLVASSISRLSGENISLTLWIPLRRSVIHNRFQNNILFIILCHLLRNVYILYVCIRFWVFKVSHIWSCKSNFILNSNYGQSKMSFIRNILSIYICFLRHQYSKQNALFYENFRTWAIAIIDIIDLKCLQMSSAATSVRKNGSIKQ